MDNIKVWLTYKSLRKIIVALSNIDGSDQFPNDWLSLIKRVTRIGLHEWNSPIRFSLPLSKYRTIQQSSI